jgi:hypothetical protein
MRGIENGNTPSAPGDVDEAVEDDIDSDTEEVTTSTVENDQELSANIIETFMRDFDEGLESDNEDEENTDAVVTNAAVTVQTNSIESPDHLTSDESYFNNVDLSKWFLEFKAMLDSQKSLDDIAQSPLKVMELLQLGKIEKGSLSMESKYKSLSARWFGCKKSTVDGEREERMKRKEGHILVGILW